MISRKSCFPLGINWLWWRTRETVLWFERFTGPRSRNLRYIFWRLGFSYWMVFILTERRPMLREINVYFAYCTYQYIVYSVPTMVSHYKVTYMNHKDILVIFYSSRQRKFELGCYSCLYVNIKTINIISISH